MKHNTLPLFAFLLFGGLNYALHGAAQQSTVSNKMDAAISQIVQRRAALARSTRGTVDSTATHLRLRPHERFRPAAPTFSPHILPHLARENACST